MKPRAVVLLLAVNIAAGAWFSFSPQQPPVQKDRYSGFEARYMMWNADTLYPLSKVDIRNGCYDVTSTLYKRRAELIEILKTAKLPSGFGGGSVRFYLHDGSEDFYVDRDGNVSTQQGDFRLSRPDFIRLRELVFATLPMNGSEMLPLEKSVIDPQ